MPDEALKTKQQIANPRLYDSFTGTATDKSAKL